MFHFLKPKCLTLSVNLTQVYFYSSLRVVCIIMNRHGLKCSKNYEWWTNKLTALVIIYSPKEFHSTGQLIWLFTIQLHVYWGAITLSKPAIHIMTLSIVTLCIMMLWIWMLSRMMLSFVMLSIVMLSKVTICIMTFCIVTLSIMMLSIVMMSIVMLSIMMLSIMALSIMMLSIMMLSIMMFCIRTFRVMTLSLLMQKLTLNIPCHFPGCYLYQVSKFA